MSRGSARSKTGLPEDVEFAQWAGNGMLRVRIRKALCERYRLKRGDLVRVEEDGESIRVTPLLLVTRRKGLKENGDSHPVAAPMEAEAQIPVERRL